MIKVETDVNPARLAFAFLLLMFTQASGKKRTEQGQKEGDCEMNNGCGT